jgi:hypothetical protein
MASGAIEKSELNSFPVAMHHEMFEFKASSAKLPVISRPGPIIAS